MKKGILLKLISFAVVTALLCMPVLAKPRINMPIIDAMMDNIATKDTNNKFEFTGSIDIDIVEFCTVGDIAIGDALCKKIEYQHSIIIPIDFNGHPLFDYVLPWNREIAIAAYGLEKQITTTANYHEKNPECGNCDVQVVFIKDKHSGASAVTCEVTFS